MWRLINDAHSLRACDSLVDQQAKEINLSLKIEAFADSLLTHKDSQIALGVEAYRVSEARRANQVDYSNGLKKEVSKFKVLTAVGGVVAILALLL